MKATRMTLFPTTSSATGQNVVIAYLMLPDPPTRWTRLRRRLRRLFR